MLRTTGWSGWQMLYFSFFNMECITIDQRYYAPIIIVEYILSCMAIAHYGHFLYCRTPRYFFCPLSYPLSTFLFILTLSVVIGCDLFQIFFKLWIDLLAIHNFHDLHDIHYFQKYTIRQEW